MPTDREDFQAMVMEVQRERVKKEYRRIVFERYLKWFIYRVALFAILRAMLRLL